MAPHIRIENLEARILLSSGMTGCHCALCQATRLNATQAQPVAQPVIHKLAAGASTVWRSLDVLPAAARGHRNFISPNAYAPFGINVANLKLALSRAPMEFTAAARRAPIVLSLPTPDGKLARFKVVESPVMEPALAAQFPDIKTYSGQGIDDPAATVRLDYTQQGFHAQVLSPRGAFYIDPYYHLDPRAYVSYYKRDYFQKQSFKCLTPAGNPIARAPAAPEFGGPESAGTILRTYRVAVTATGEYTAFQGGTVGAGLSAVATLINRVTGVYETDFAVRMTLIASENQLIFTNPNADPFSSPDTPTTTNSQNQSYVDAVIGSGNYDFGHVVHWGEDNGLAGAIGNVGVAGQKAKGYSSHSAPVGDPMAIDYVAHEMGHQFGAHHDFNNCGGGQGDDPFYAQEPGSGSTIMAYAGICGAGYDLQAHSDPYFHGLSWQQITSYTQFGIGDSVAQKTNTGNTIPIVNAGGAYTIPARTPFALTAAVFDPDGDAITYDWEQRNGGNPVTVGTDPGAGPIFRSWSPSTKPTRTFPSLPYLLSNLIPFGETLPQTTRSMIFSIVARDNRSGGGGTNMSSTTISVVNTGAAFAVTSPNSAGLSFNGGSNLLVTWNVAGTNANGINCAAVNIKLSLDGGLTYPVMLTGSTPNDGFESVQLPFDTAATNARLRVEAADNVFFDVANYNFNLVNVPGVPAPAAPALTAAADTGVSDSDHITRLNNGSLASVLQFTVAGTIAGYTVDLYADGVMIGSADATGTTTTIVTNGTSTIPDGARAITARQHLGANAPSALSAPLSITIDSVVPALLSPPSFVFATSPHRLVMSFSEDVGATLDNADVAVTTLPGGTPVGKSFSYNAATHQATFNFGAILADGDYRSQLNGPGITDVAGNAMTSVTTDFFFLTADANHDRAVNLLDFNILAVNFGLTGRDFTQGDFTYDGTVNLSDFNLLGVRFGTGLAPNTFASATPISRATGSDADELLTSIV